MSPRIVALVCFVLAAVVFGLLALAGGGKLDDGLFLLALGLAFLALPEG